MSRILYRLIAALARLAVRSGRSRDLEIIVLRHQLTVLSRPIDRPTLNDNDRTDTDSATLLVGVVSLVVIVGIRFSKVKVPGALVLVIGGLIASVALDFEDEGIALVGDVPRGFAAPKIPTVGFVIENFATIGPAALGLLRIGFSQTAAMAARRASWAASDSSSWGPSLEPGGYQTSLPSMLRITAMFCKSYLSSL